LAKLLTIEGFRSSAKDGGKPDGMVVRESVAPVEAIADSRRRKFIFSDGSLDRAGDTISAAGWVLDNYNKNPIALFGHDSWNVDSVIGRGVNVGKVGQKLIGEIDFATVEVNPKADMALRMVDAGLLSAVSVGFLPIEYAWSSDKERPYGIDFIKQELLEISLVPVPCNSNALIQARSLGIDVGPLAEWAERILDGEGRVPVPRPFLEEIFRAAKTPRPIRQKYLSPETRTESNDWRVGADHELPVEKSDSWDGAAAAARMLASAGFDGDSPDAAMARRGFLVYDAANPALKASYKLPFADIVGGELKAMDGGLSAVASRLAQTDAPQNVLDEARGLLDKYEAAGKSTVVRAGRKISAANAAMLTKAMDHHQAATDCIKAVLTSNADDADGDDDNAGDGEGDPEVPLDPEIIRGQDPARDARLRKATALKLQLAGI
jgi:HK97 family phage prohead protease